MLFPDVPRHPAQYVGLAQGLLLIGFRNVIQVSNDQ